MASDLDSKFDDEFPAHKAGSLDDLALLPKRFDQFAGEVRSTLELLTNRIIPFIERADAAIADLRERVTTTEKRLDAIEARMSAPGKRRAKR